MGTFFVVVECDSCDLAFRGVVVLSCLVLSCLVLSCLVLSCLVLSCLVLSCLVLSCLVLSCLVLSCLVLSCLVLSCLVLSCLENSESACRRFLERGKHTTNIPREDPHRGKKNGILGGEKENTARYFGPPPFGPCLTAPETPGDHVQAHSCRCFRQCRNLNPGTGDHFPQTRLFPHASFNACFPPRWPSFLVS